MDCGDRIVRGLCHPARGPSCGVVSRRVALQGFGSNPQFAWMATNVAVAVAAQVLVGVVLYWSLGGGWVRKIAWLGVIPLTAALNVGYLSAIPALFLIEADTAAERNPWTEHCFVRGAELRPIRTPVTQASPGPRAWWVALPPDGHDALLRVPDCTLTDAVIPKAGRSPEGYLDFFTSLQFASPDGAAIIEQTDRRTTLRTWSCWSIQALPFSLWPPRAIGIRARRCCRTEATRWRISRPSWDPVLRCFIACRYAKRPRSQRRQRSRWTWLHWDRPRMC